MSQIGLYAGLYDQLREYAYILDRILIEIKGGKSTLDAENRKKLGVFLENLASNRGEDLPTRLIYILLRDETELDVCELAKIGRQLSSNTADGSIIEPLEKLAQALEHEQAGVMARIRG